MILAQNVLEAGAYAVKLRSLATNIFFRTLCDKLWNLSSIAIGLL
jgi:hypothetical protein